MKINEKMLYLPPYLSTTWSQVKALYDKGGILIVTLADGDTVHVPGLNQEEIKQIFSMHASYLEHASENKDPQRFVSPFNFMSSKSDDAIETPLKLAFGAFDSLGSAMQHNPAQSNAPLLPQEILNKIAAISKIVAPEEISALPQAEPHCNCFHCQIARAIQQAIHPAAKEIESEGEIVTDADLQFQEWEIKQMDDKIFQVTNRLDNREQYQVYLGEPVGCTCGKQNCEHIIAVLKS